MTKGGAKWQEIPTCEIERMCRYVKDDGAIAAYFRIPRYEVKAVREAMPKAVPPKPKPITAKSEEHINTSTRKHDDDARMGCERLLYALERSNQVARPEVTRRRTFAEQLALVASGRATIVEWRP